MILYLEDIKRSSFSGGERHVVLPPVSEQVDILKARIRSANDLMDLMLVTDILERQGNKPKVLYIPYMPYARQDRQTSQDTSFSLAIVAKMINSLNYEKVYVYEPHSDVASALLNKCTVIPSDPEVMKFCNHLARTTNNKEKLTVIAPDGGSIKRVERFLSYVPKNDGVEIDNFGIAIKHRDVNTGHVTIKDVIGDLNNKRLLVIDDICDGGATFIQLAKVVREKFDVQSLNLFVAHGIFSKGLNNLYALYENIGTTDSFYDDTDTRVHISEI
jgi:ribose-phosphate pyrophosphokinase